jgi:hypothetical protein
VAAREEQLEPLVGNRLIVHGVLHCLPDLQQPGLLPESAVAPDAVDRPVARRRDEPGARVVRRPVARPALGGCGERVLRGFLGELEVAEEADQSREDAPPLVAEDLVEDR